MYLKQIKLAGFKSFVDPTVIPIQSPLNAIVGPNGCGKSNIVDAIRWVIGETSAKQLRGQSMSDVIFNGTATRQPLGRAMVELLFDNSSHRLTGEYAAYTEICIRREVEREGQSSYYLNGTQCRRKDIIDIFLGTGLGPRSYSIIEQGMISRLIEAKPEELRNFVEEAAGVSKYKERRRETQNRMRHTEENLSRVNDLCDELERQLNRLQRQAKSAEKYKLYKQQEDELQLQLKGLHWKQLQGDLEIAEQSLLSQQTQFEQSRADSQRIETELEKLRIAQNDLNSRQGEVQKVYYESKAEVSTLEQRIQHLQHQTKQWQQELDSAGERWQSLSESTEEQSLERSELQADIEMLSPQLVDCKAEVDQLNDTLEIAELEQQQWQQGWDNFQQNMSQTSKQVEVKKNTLDHLRLQQSNLSNKQQNLQLAHDEIDLNQLQQDIDQLTQLVSEVSEKMTNDEAQMAESGERINALRDEISQQRQHLEAQREQMQTLKGREASLQALQQAALRDDDQQISQWLQDQGLSGSKRLGELLQVESGWEPAVEAVLFDCFKAVCVDTPKNHLQALLELTGGSIAFVSTQSEPGSVRGESLAAKVNSQCSLPIDLSMIMTADNLNEAVELVERCQPGESVITPEGVWIGKNWVKLACVDDAKHGVIQREQELTQMTTDIEQLLACIDDVDAIHSDKLQCLQEQEMLRDQYQQTYQQSSQQLSQYKSELSASSTQHQSRTQRLAQLAEELEQTSEQLQAVVMQVDECESQIVLASRSEDDLKLQHGNLVAERDQKREAVLNARQQLQMTRQTSDELAMRLATSENQLALLEQSLNQDRLQMQNLSQRKQQLSEQLSNDDLPMGSLQQDLQQKLGDSVELESKLSQVQSELQQTQSQYQQLDSQRHDLQSAVQHQQAQLQQMQMDKQTLVVKQATIIEQLTELDQNIDAILPTIPDEATIPVWAEELVTLEKRISRLGPINLAAIEEYDEVNERKTYLDSQQADLREALATLESAIKKIDKETRDNFRNTFDTINGHFKQIFPKVFGGGRAEMVLTDDDLLVAGVQIKAQPPGKRNSTIQMLSGGEKALTAIAMVFSLFQLNPAPFCILDEVDAPLDDLNVGRYCALIREMIGQTQFLVISHNKVTIEAADSLLGVTQQEPGVSRMVAVDIEQAVAMAEA